MIFGNTKKNLLTCIVSTHIHNSDFGLYIKTHSFKSHDSKLDGVFGWRAGDRPRIHVLKLWHPIQHSHIAGKDLGSLREAWNDHPTKLLIRNNTCKQIWKSTELRCAKAHCKTKPISHFRLVLMMWLIVGTVTCIHHYSFMQNNNWMKESEDLISK